MSNIVLNERQELGQIIFGANNNKKLGNSNKHD